MQKTWDEPRERAEKSLLVWVERSGKRTPLAEMSDSHLNFAIDMVQRSIQGKSFWRASFLPYLKEERRYRRALINKKGFVHANPDKVQPQRYR